MKSVGSILRKYVFDVFKDSEPASVKFRLRDILFFTRFVKPVWKIGLLSLLTTIITTGIGSLTPLSSKILIDFTLLKRNFSNIEAVLNSFHLQVLVQPLQKIFGSLNLLVLVGLIFGLTLGFLGILRRLLNFKFINEITFHVQTSLFEHILRYPLSVLKKNQVGYLMSRVTGDVNTVQSFFMQIASLIAANLLTPLFSFIILFQLNWKVTLILLTILPLNVLFNYFTIKRTRSLSYKQLEKSSDITGDIQEVLSGIEVVKSYGTEERETKKVSGKMKSLLQLQLKSTLLSSFSEYIANGSNLITKLLVLWFTANAVLRGAMTVGDLATFSWYAMNLSGTLNSLLNQVVSFQYTFISMARLLEMFGIASEFDKHGKAAGVAPAETKGHLTFQNVSFSYDGKEPVLNNLSLTIHPGETIAITGASGVGKTTLISLILKFYHPQSGSITLDGNDLESIDTQWLRGQVGIVSQETFLFNDTIEHNIKYSSPSATREEVIHAARKAHIDEDIQGFKSGYHTIVGERGTKLSVGQKQRISLARAFLKSTPILILDEPSSSLDRETEEKLADSLREITKNHTTIVISHRAPVVHIAHRTFVLNDGALVEKKTSSDRGRDDTSMRARKIMEWKDLNKDI